MRFAAVTTGTRLVEVILGPDGTDVDLRSALGLARKLNTLAIVERTAGPGLPAEGLARVTCRARLGGETFQRTPGGTRRALKKQFQAAGIPSWCRGAPLL